MSRGLWTSGDRWTCPACGKTDVPDTRDDVTLAFALRLAQVQHARRHDTEVGVSRGHQ